jgi:hypothetical protein
VTNNIYRGKSSPIIFATFLSFKKQPKVNNCPKSEKSPNLVTLPVALKTEGTLCIHFDHKNVFGYIMGDFFTNSSGHPASNRADKAESR